ncbi:MAG: beta-N-acetylhexosaminidase [Gammaproteobacteria bacterium]|nr:beta-N-acetylhexosaminidase [Gammaproteobacteria bacterium]MCF6229421.1 beta-N-acetylhexosaminidase [Gammaproteobacteria bacterium]
MSLGPLMLDLQGVELTAEEREILQNPLVGGVILFSRNYESPEQLTALISEIHTLRKPKLLVAVDHEGGRVQRFRSGFSRLPAVSQIGVNYKERPRYAKELAETAGWLMAAELRAVGVDFSFAPVLDLDYGQSEVVGDRAWHRDPQAVAELSHAYMTGMQSAGMAATGKHFPGHGWVSGDSHTAMPVDERRYEDIYPDDILPFERMINYGMAAIMPAHVIYSRCDEQPAGFSPFWLQEVLRRRLNFQGVIFSDDLSMAAAGAGGGFVERAEKALDAGCDMLLVCNDRSAVLEILQGLKDRNDAASHSRLARMHGRHRVTRVELLRDPAWEQAVMVMDRLHDDDELLLDI